MSERKDGDVIGATIDLEISDICDGTGRLIRTTRHWEARVTYAYPSWRPDEVTRIVATGASFEAVVGKLAEVVL